MSQYIFFCSHKRGSHPQFSNWYPQSYTGSDGCLTFSCSEQEFMFLKALEFSDTETATKILGTTDPQEIKQLGRQIQNYNNEVWNALREKKDGTMSEK